MKRAAISEKNPPGSSAADLTQPRQKVRFNGPRLCGVTDLAGAINQSSVVQAQRKMSAALQSVPALDNSMQPAQLNPFANSPTTVSQLAGVVQMGRHPALTDPEVDVIEDLGSGQGLHMFYTKNKTGDEYHVDLWLGKEKRIGRVDIVPRGDNLELHTNSDEQGGRGSLLVSTAIVVIKKYHAGGDGFVTLPMGGGAVVKLICSRLSQHFGDPDLHAAATEAEKERKEENKDTKDTYDPNRFDPRFTKEHLLHLRAIGAKQEDSGIQFDTNLGRLDMSDEEVLSLEDELQQSDKLDKDFPLYHFMLLKGVSKLTISMPKQLFRRFSI